MSKFTDAVKAALKAYFQTGDTPTEAQFAEVFDRIQEGIQEHQHVPTGGAGTGTGDAGPINVFQYNPQTDVVFVEGATQIPWTDLDLSAYAPVGTKVVLLFVTISDGSVANQPEVLFRKNGEFTTIARVAPSVAGYPQYAHVLVPVDTNRVIEYRYCFGSGDLSLSIAYIGAIVG